MSPATSKALRLAVRSVRAAQTHVRHAIDRTPCSEAERQIIRLDLMKLHQQEARLLSRLSAGAASP